MAIIPTTGLLPMRAIWFGITGTLQTMGEGRAISATTPCMTMDGLTPWKGGHSVCVGDWIIKGVKGEFYPCKPDIFAATYELAGA